jgi:hypothetical protein
MSFCSRRACLAVLAGVVGSALGGALGCGSDMGSMAYFLSPEQRLPAKIKHLASEDKKKTPKVMILTYTGLETRSEFIHADRQLAEMLAKNLEQMAEESKEKLSVVPARKVEDFKNANPNWREMDLTNIGKKFGADYVVYLEINSMSLYETNSLNQLFRGRANLLVSLIDVSKPDETPAQEPYSCTFPSDARGPVPVGLDTNPIQFRQMFLSHMARQLSWYFSNYPRSERRQIEQVF